MSDTHTGPLPFAGAHFDRLGERRRDANWLHQQWRNDATRIIPVWGTRNLIDPGNIPQPVMLTTDQVEALGKNLDDMILLGALDSHVFFAVDLGNDDKQPPLAGEFRGLRSVGNLLSATESALLGYAQAMVLWQRRQKFCGSCGAGTVADEAGHVMRCCSPDCDQAQFPRLDPAIIVLVEHQGRALLGRQPSWPEGIYSTIAGFVEPGESLEDAVFREVYEETGVEVANSRYHNSQPWPFPSSLMLGFNAQAAAAKITLHDQELEDARWFSRTDFAAGVRAGRLRAPSALSISSQLIRAWFDKGSQGTFADLPSPFRQ